MYISEFLTEESASAKLRKGPVCFENTEGWKLRKDADIKHPAGQIMKVGEFQ